jgi:hypothetical protein
VNYPRSRWNSGRVICAKFCVVKNIKKENALPTRQLKGEEYYTTTC